MRIINRTPAKVQKVTPQQAQTAVNDTPAHKKKAFHLTMMILVVVAILGLGGTLIYFNQGTTAGQAISHAADVGATLAAGSGGFALGVGSFLDINEITTFPVYANIPTGKTGKVFDVRLIFDDAVELQDKNAEFLKDVNSAVTIVEKEYKTEQGINYIVVTGAAVDSELKGLVKLFSVSVKGVSVKSEGSLIDVNKIDVYDSTLDEPTDLIATSVDAKFSVKPGKEGCTDKTADNYDATAVVNKGCKYTEKLCTDGKDNDGDSLIDCKDSDCANEHKCKYACTQDSECNQGADIQGKCVNNVCEMCNDDSTCSAATTLMKPYCSPLKICVECKLDSECTLEAGGKCSAGTCKYSTEVSCSDQTDNDGDGLVDCKDPECKLDGSCVDITCKDDSECGANGVCADSGAAAGAATPKYCQAKAGYVGTKVGGATCDAKLAFECKSGACTKGKCEAVVGAACASGTYQCVGDELQVCEAGTTAAFEWKKSATCPVGKCDANAGKCGTVGPTCAANDGCKTGCTPVDADCPKTPVCGDGKLEAPETCDDGNKVDGDGCSATCTKEKVLKNDGATCTSGTECKSGLCPAGVCSPTKKSCTAAADCAAGEICTAGFCEKSAAGKTACPTGTECAAGEKCVAGVCEAGSLCTAGELQCNGNILELCTAGVWGTKETCTEGCDAAAKKCKVKAGSLDADNDGVDDSKEKVECKGKGKSGAVYSSGANIGCPLGDSDGNGCVDFSNVIKYISQWKKNEVGFSDVIKGISNWKSKEGCSA